MITPNEPVAGPQKNMRRLEVQCHMCRKNYTLWVPLEGFRKWQGGELIQNAMPDLTPDQRELLISHTCGVCFDKLFKE